MSTKEISAAAQALGRRGGLKSLGAKSKAELSTFGKAAAQKRWKKVARCEISSGCVFSPGHQGACHIQDPADPNKWIMPVGGMFSAGAQQLEALAGAVGLKGAVVKADPPKPRRALPKAGTVNAFVLAAMSIKPLTAEAIYERADGVPAGSFDRVRNALSSLRSAGHVVSEPKPGSRKEKLWRLA